jgi:leucyl aminopeptidase (aminopeptidase T)
METSASGRLVVNEVRDFGVRGLEMDFKRGKITALKAEDGMAEFASYLGNAKGNKDKLAEFGVGINHGMKPIGLRISDEKALGTVHLAIGNNVHLGGVNRASIHIDFNLDKPTIKADGDLVMERGQIMTKAPGM